MTDRCAIVGCGRPRYAREWCSLHYNRAVKAAREGGEPLPPIESRAERVPCAAEGCDRMAETKGLCSKHYQRERASKGIDPESRAAYLADIAAHRASARQSLRYESDPALARLASALQAALQEAHYGGASDEQKLASLRNLAERTLGRSVAFPEPEQPVTHESRRLSESQLSDLAWTAPHGVRGLPC